MPEEKSIGNRPATRLAVESRVTFPPEKNVPRYTSAHPEATSRDERAPDPLPLDTNLPTSPTIAGLAVPATHKGAEKPMKSKSDSSIERYNEIRHLAEKELRRGRPLVILSQVESETNFGPNTNGKWLTGFDYQVLAQRNKQPNVSYVDPKEIYFTNNFSVNVFYGPGNKSKLSINISNFEKHDRDGNLIQSILGINAPGRVTADQAEGIGLLAACIRAGYVESSSIEEAQKLLQMLSPDVRKECLRHAVIFSCRLGSKTLVDELLKLDANPNVVSDDDGSMPLEIATEKENFDLVRTLLEHGADPDIELSSGMTPRSLAEDAENPAISRLFEAIPEKTE